MRAFLLSSFVLFLSLLSSSHSALHYPTALLSRLEHLLVDTDGAFRSGFKDAITPCSNYVSGSQLFGRQTSSQWLRVAFHDFVTAHVDEGTGGIDASIGFETLRSEDSGSAFNDSFAFFAPYVDARTSMADLVALSVVLSVGNCGGPQVPLRGGRIDATTDGAFGVPEPETDLTETLAEFASAGFNAVDSIGLTACGHSLGRVHHGGFPQVVPASAVTANNTAGGVNLDSTPAEFDVVVVREYLGGNGQRGGPLVTSDNVTVRSDLRLYESDGNATMRALGASKEGFAATCKGLFERMINTVPKEVVLSAVVTPLRVKPVNVSFDIDLSGDPLGRLVFGGSIRILRSDDESAPAAIHYSVSAGSNHYSGTASALSETGSNIWGNTTFYPFSVTVPTNNSPPSALTISSSGIPSTTFKLQSAAFLIPSLTSATNNDLTISAAVLKGYAKGVVAVSAQIVSPIPQQGTLAPAITSQSVDLVYSKSVGNYDIYSVALASDAAADLSKTSVDITAEFKRGSKVVDEYNLLTFLS